jgi:hypothetical protein
MTNMSDKRSKRVSDTSSSTKSSSPEKTTKTLLKSKPNKKQHMASPEKENSKANQPNTVSAPKKTSAKQKTQKRKIITPAPDADTDEQNVETIAATAKAVEAPNDEECPNGLRRSKRAKIGHGCHAKYNWDEIVDYGGNKVRVLSTVGTLDQRNLFAESARKYLQSLEAKKTEREKARKKSSSKSPRKRVSKKSSKKVQEEEEEEPVAEEEAEEAEKEIEEAPKKLSKEERKQLKYEAKVRMRKEEKRRLRKLEKEKDIREEKGYTEGGDGQDYVMNWDQQQQQQQHDESLSQSTSQASLEQFTQYSESQINGTQETILVHNQKTNTNKNQRMYLFANADRKYEELMPGVGVVIISKERGIYRLDPLCYNSTSLHDVAISYFVQNGSIMCSINGIISRHATGDIIDIPKGNSLV